MVSGFFTSPNDQERIMSGEASAILMPSKSRLWRCWLNRLSKSFIEFLQMVGPYHGQGPESCSRRRLLLVQLDVDAQGTDFLDQHIERFRDAGDGFVLAVDD